MAKDTTKPTMNSSAQQKSQDDAADRAFTRWSNIPSKSQTISLDFKTIAAIIGILMAVGSVVWSASSTAANKANTSDVSILISGLNDKIDVLDRSSAGQGADIKGIIRTLDSLERKIDGLRK